MMTSFPWLLVLEFVFLQPGAEEDQEAKGACPKTWRRALDGSETAKRRGEIHGEIHGEIPQVEVRKHPLNDVPRCFWRMKMNGHALRGETLPCWQFLHCILSIIMLSVLQRDVERCSNWGNVESTMISFLPLY